jgi:hypothetical protein
MVLNWPTASFDPDRSALGRAMILEARARRRGVEHLNPFHAPGSRRPSSQFRYELQTGRRSDYLAIRSSRKASRTARGRD